MGLEGNKVKCILEHRFFQIGKIERMELFVAEHQSKPGWVTFLKSFASATVYHKRVGEWLKFHYLEFDGVFVVSIIYWKCSIFCEQETRQIFLKV